MEYEIDETIEETYEYDYAKCPHCGHINTDDGRTIDAEDYPSWEFEDVLYECESCDKKSILSGFIRAHITAKAVKE